MIKKAAGDRAHGSVLDIGCGIGLYLERLAELSPQVHGVEFDFSRAKTAREKDLSLTSSAGEILPFPSNTFDLVLSHEVLEHVEDDRTSVEEIVRVLRAPGSEPSTPGGSLAPHVRVYSKRDLEKLFVHLPVRIIERKIIFGAYDNIIARWPRAGRGIRRFLHMLEATPLRFFGLSHFWVVERISSQY
jgi:SAM-dependent methyltransferase